MTEPKNPERILDFEAMADYWFKPIPHPWDKPEPKERKERKERKEPDETQE